MTDPEDNNGLKPLIKWELVWMVVQFLVLISAVIYSYATTQSRLNVMEQILNQHISQHNQYLRIDVWDVRNRFVDEKLNRMDQKLDYLIEQQSKDSDRVFRGR